MRQQITEGSPVPSFILPDQHGNQVNINNFLGKPMVIYFYPKDETAGCTKEACSFRDAYEAFQNVGAEVIGISSDSVASHKSFGQKLRLPFILLSDEGGRVRKQFGVPSGWLGLFPGRVTYIIDRDGIVRYIFNSQLQIQKHINKALEVLEGLEKAF